MDVENTNLISACHNLFFYFGNATQKTLKFFREDLGSLRVGIDSHGDVEGSHRGHQLHHDGAAEQRRHSNSHSQHGEEGGGWVRGGGGEQLEGTLYCDISCIWSGHEVEMFFTEKHLVVRSGFCEVCS